MLDKPASTKSGDSSIASEAAAAAHRVAVVIVNFNSGQLLKRCLLSLSRQTYREFKTLIVDNGSQDSSLHGIVEAFPAVEILLAHRNLGFAAANNVGIRHLADSEWIALLNPDAFPEHDWLENLLRAAKSQPQFSFFGSRMLIADRPHLLDGAGDAYHVSGLVWRQGHGHRADVGYAIQQEIFSPCAAAALYRRSVFHDVGGFDEDYFCYVEDIDLAFRLRLAGHRCLYVPSAVVHHVGSATTGKQSNFTLYHGHRNLVWTYIKNMPSWLFWFYLPAHLLLNLASIFWFAIRGQARIVLRAKLDAFAGIPKMWRKRQVIQEMRSVGAWELRRLMHKGFIRK
jgi:GT2 family glycosyltransferase